MFVRRRRPLLRAAMVGGTAYHAGKRRQKGRPTPLTGETLAQLEQLASLKERGVLSEEEFEAQKHRLLET